MPASNPKEAKLDSDEVDANSSLDISATQSALEDIDACQNDIDNLNEKASEEILSVEQKFNKLRRPHYIKRNEIVQKIPSFWYTAFVNHPQISSILSNDEEDCLQSLSSVDVEEFEDIKSGYKITFAFKSNTFFSNEKLVKEFHLATSGEPQSHSTPIEWKAGQNLVSKNEKAANGRKRPASESDGFFTWFTNNSDPNADEIAEVIKDDMWPNPLQYYLAPEIEVENGLSDEDSDDLDEEAVVEVPEDFDSEEDDEDADEALDEDDDEDED